MICVCMYCRAGWGELDADLDPTPSHGVCLECQRLPVDTLDEISRVLHAVRRAGGRIPASPIAARSPFVVLSRQLVDEVLRLGLDVGSLPLVSAALRVTACGPGFSDELDVAHAPKRTPLLAAVAGASAS